MKPILTAVATIALALFTVFASGASAATVALGGVETRVTVTAPLGALGLSGAPFGTATVATVDGRPVFTFPITGGTLDTATGQALIEHDGSGVTLAAGPVSATVGNFLIDTASALVRGDLIDIVTGTSVASGLELFTFGTDTTLPGVELLISGTLAGALTATFGADDLTGAQFGFAEPNVAPVPVPAAGVLLLGGLGLMGVLRARRKTA